jgi:hypothetical protein
MAEMDGYIERFGRSWQLFKASAEVLRSDRELILLPLCSAVAVIMLAAGFVYGLNSGGAYVSLENKQVLTPDTTLYIAVFLFYVAQYTVIFFFNTALVGAAIERLDGGNPTLGSALGLAASRIGPILGYAIIAATVGMVLRIVSERLGFIGRLIVAGIGLTWTVATFLVVPVLAAEGVGPVAAIGRSTELLKKSWGENLIGVGGITLVISAVTFLLVLIAVGSGFMIDRGENIAFGLLLIGGSIGAMLALALIGSALTGIYTAALYYFAVTGETPQGFDRGLMSAAFTRKR